MNEQAKRNGSLKAWHFSNDSNTVVTHSATKLQFPAQHHLFPVVLLVLTGFVVLAIVSLGGNLRTVSHVASRPTNYVVLMCNTSSTITCACAWPFNVL